MKLEEFKQKLSKIEVFDTRWKDKMMSVVNLYKALGFGVKDILNNKNILFDEVHSHVVGLLDNIIDPTTEKFYIHMLMQREIKNVAKIQAKLTPEYINRVMLGDFENKGIDINDEEAFLERKYGTLALRAAKLLTRNSDFSVKMLNYLLENHDIKSKKDFIENMTQTQNGAIKCVCDFITRDASAKKAFESVFIKLMQDEEKEMRLDIRNGLVNRITKITNFFNQCGYLEEIMQINNSAMEKFAIPMKVSMEDNNADFNLMNLLNPAYYEQFSTEELFVFSAFYCNRLEKIVENINDGIYLQHKLGTFYDCVDYGEIPRNIGASDAIVVLKQKYFMEELSKGKFKNFKDSEFKEGDTIDFSYVPEEYIREYENVYSEYFDRYIRGNENSFVEDYRFAFIDRSISYCMYNLKDFSIESLLYTLSQNQSKINFGLIKERRSIKNEYGEEQVLIGVDYKEFPTIRLHFPKKDFDEFVERFFPNGDFPEYIGNEDFSINETEIKTSILYKFTKKQKQAIKKEMELEKDSNRESNRYKFLRHMYENIHPNQNKLNKKTKNNNLDKI